MHPLQVGNGEIISSHILLGVWFSSMLGLKLIHASKMGLSWNSDITGEQYQCRGCWYTDALCREDISKHCMMTSSNGNIFRVTGHLCGVFTGLWWIPRTKSQWRGALMFSLICVWINDWVNNREAGDLRRYRAHYDVIGMVSDKLNRHIFVDSN